MPAVRPRYLLGLILVCACGFFVTRPQFNPDEGLLTPDELKTSEENKTARSPDRLAELEEQLNQEREKVTALQKEKEELIESVSEYKQQKSAAERDFARQTAKEKRDEEEIARLAGDVKRAGEHAEEQKGRFALEEFRKNRSYRNFISNWYRSRRTAEEINCADVANCFFPQCYSRTDDKCEANPRFLPANKPTNPTQMNGEAFCRSTKGQKKPINPVSPPPLPRLDESFADENAKHESRLDAFKNLTAGPFNQWFDWKPNCVFDWNEKGKMSAKHVKPSDGNTGNAFLMKNVCVRPFGRLAGYEPNVGSFDGVDEMLDSKAFAGLKAYLSDVESLEKAPRCFIDTVALMMPVTAGANDPVRVYHRMASLLETRKKMYPKAKRKDTATIYALLSGAPSFGEQRGKDYNNGLDDDFNLSDLRGTAFKQFYTVATGSHFAVAGPNADRHVLKQRVFGSSGFNDPRMSELMCFKQIAVHFTATEAEATELREKQSTAREIAPLIHHRSASVLENFNAAIRECADAADRRTAPSDVKTPKVLLALRSGERRWSLSPRIVSLLDDYFTTVGAQFFVHDAEDSSPLDLARVYGDFDILIGPSGAGLHYGIHMPPSSVVAELSFAAHRCAATTGIDHSDNRWCDHAGNYWALGIHHVVATFGSDSTCGVRPRAPFARQEGEWEMNPETVVKVAEAAYCALTKSDDSKPKLPGDVPGISDKCNEHLTKATELQEDLCASPSWKSKYEGAYRLFQGADNELRKEFPSAS